MVKKPSFHRLWVLNDAIRHEVDAACPKDLLLAGERPSDWPQVGTPKYNLAIERIKSGLTFYCMEDFLWPNGRGRSGEREIFIGLFPPSLLQIGKDGLPNISDITWSPRHPGVQPVAMRSYDDAKLYWKAGSLLERRFLPLLSKRWMVRYNLIESVPVSSTFQKRFRGNLLYYSGEYPSKIAEQFLPEIRFLLGVGPSKRHEPPSASYEHAFRRQTNILTELWQKVQPEKSSNPSLEWVRKQLERPEYADFAIENGFANRYRKALIFQMNFSE